MEENKDMIVEKEEIATLEETEDVALSAELSTEDTDIPLDKNVRLMSPTRMLFRRFFRSKLSIAGLIMLASLFLFCWSGPLFYHAWGETESDRALWNTP